MIPLVSILIAAVFAGPETTEAPVTEIVDASIGTNETDEITTLIPQSSEKTETLEDLGHYTHKELSEEFDVQEGLVVDLQDKNFKAFAREYSDEPVIIRFCAPWASSFDLTRNAIDEVAAQKKMLVADLDLEYSEEVQAFFEIMRYPRLFVLLNGELRSEYEEGMWTLDSIQDWFSGVSTSQNDSNEMDEFYYPTTTTIAPEVDDDVSDEAAVASDKTEAKEAGDAPEDSLQVSEEAKDSSEEDSQQVPDQAADQKVAEDDTAVDGEEDTDNAKFIGTVAGSVAGGILLCATSGFFAWRHVSKRKAAAGQNPRPTTEEAESENSSDPVL